MLILLATGKLLRDPTLRIASTGNRFATALLSVATDDGQLLVSCIAFAEVAEKLLKHSKGDTVCVLGKAKLTSWERDGEQKHGLSLTVDKVLSPYELSKRREAATA